MELTAEYLVLLKDHKQWVLGWVNNVFSNHWLSEQASLLTWCPSSVPVLVKIRITAVQPHILVLLWTTATSLPTMQLDYRQFSQRIGPVILAAANVGWGLLPAAGDEGVNFSLTLDLHVVSFCKLVIFRPKQCWLLLLFSYQHHNSNTWKHLKTDFDVGKQKQSSQREVKIQNIWFSTHLS